MLNIVDAAVQSRSTAMPQPTSGDDKQHLLHTATGRGRWGGRGPTAMHDGADPLLLRRQRPNVPEEKDRNEFDEAGIS
jgi:hypothetical protein